MILTDTYASNCMLTFFVGFAIKYPTITFVFNPQICLENVSDINDIDCYCNVYYIYVKYMQTYFVTHVKQMRLKLPIM